MALTHRPVTADDAEEVAALMSRIAADHPTGFELSASEVRELLADYPGVVVEGGWDGARPGRLHGDPAAGAERRQPALPALRRRGPGPAGRGLRHRDARARARRRTGDARRRARPGDRARFQTRALAGRDDQAACSPSTASAVDRHNFLMFSDLAALPEPVLPDDLVVATFDPATGEELRVAHNEAFRDYPNGTAVDEQTWSGFMLTAAHTRHEQSFVLRDPAADGRVAAYVFVHEYALAPSGEQGREAYVAYVGTLPPYRGRGLATHLLAHTLHACRAAGFDTSSLDVDTPEPHRGAGDLRAGGVRRALPPGQLRARGGAGRVDQVRPVTGALPGVQGGLVVAATAPTARASARRHAPGRDATARRGGPRSTPAS